MNRKPKGVRCELHQRNVEVEQRAREMSDKSPGSPGKKTAGQKLGTLSLGRQPAPGRLGETLRTEAKISMLVGISVDLVFDPEDSAHAACTPSKVHPLWQVGKYALGTWDAQAVACGVRGPYRIFLIHAVVSSLS